MENFKKPAKKSVYFNPVNRKATKNARKESRILDMKETKKSLSGLRKSGRAK